MITNQAPRDEGIIMHLTIQPIIIQHFVIDISQQKNIDRN